MDQTHNNFEHLSDSLSDGIILVDAHSQISFANLAAVQLLGITKSNLIGRRFDEAVNLQRDGVATTDNSPVDLAIGEESTFTTDREPESRYTMARSDRSMLPVNMVVSPYRPDNLPGASITFHDRSADEKIDHAKSEFVALVSHQLRTPVNIISWYIEKLLNAKHGDLNEQQQSYLKQIYESNKRVVDLIQAIVNVSRTDLSGLKHKHEQVKLDQTVSKLIDENQEYIKQKSLHFASNFVGNDFTLKDSDQELCAVILRSIIQNSTRYTFEGGMINLELKQLKVGDQLNPERNSTAKTGGVLVSVSDNGMGIPDEEKSRIFTKLFRGSNVQTVDVTGVGLGLYIANSFVLELGGEIWFTSEVRSGTTFYVFLPSE